MDIAIGNPLKYLDPTGHDVAVDNYKPNYEDPAYYSFYRWWNGNPWDRFGMDPAYMYPEAFLNTLYMLEEKGINTKNLDTCQLDLLYDRVHRGEDMTRLQVSKIFMILGIEYNKSTVRTGGAGNGALTDLIESIQSGKTPVIGKMIDLEIIGKNEVRVADYLPYKGNPQADWQQNSSVLRQVMNEGKPIRDASPFSGKVTNDFLGMERNLLQNHDWTYKNGYWLPPK